MRRWWEVSADATMLLVVCVRVCVCSFHDAMSGDKDVRCGPWLEVCGDEETTTTSTDMNDEDTTRRCAPLRSSRRTVRFSTRLDVPLVLKRLVGIERVPVADTITLSVFAGLDDESETSLYSSSSDGVLVARTVSQPVLGFPGGDMFEAACETLFYKRRRRAGTNCDVTIAIADADGENADGDGWETVLVFKFTFTAKVWGVQALAESSMRDSTLGVAKEMVRFIEDAVQRARQTCDDELEMDDADHEEEEEEEEDATGAAAAIVSMQRTGMDDWHDDFFDAFESFAGGAGGALDTDASLHEVAAELARIDMAVRATAERVRRCGECVALACSSELSSTSKHRHASSIFIAPSFWSSSSSSSSSSLAAAVAAGALAGAVAGAFIASRIVRTS